MPDVDLSVFAGPGGLMADTVEDVVEYLGDHSEQRSSFEAELRLEGEVDLTVGAFEVNVSGDAGASTTSTAMRRRSSSAPRPRGASICRRGRGHHRQRRAVGRPPGGTGLRRRGQRQRAGPRRHVRRRGVGGHRGVPQRHQRRLGAAGRRCFRRRWGWTSASTPSSTCRTRSSSSERRPPQRHGQRWGGDGRPAGPPAGVRGAGPGRRHEQPLDSWDIGIASLEIEQSRSANAFTWVKPPGGDFTHVGYGELREDRADV